MDQPICGFVRVEGMCRDPREPGALRCHTHLDPSFMVCVGCAGQAHKQCPVDRGGQPCDAAICLSCVHHFTDERGHHHGLPENVRVGDFVGSQKAVVRDVRQELIDVVATTLRDAEGNDRLRLSSDDMATTVGAAVLDALSIHITLKLLSGIAGSSE